ncbi:hypothetical protein P7C70_g2394, partial [Phenoliferia sp. Uapishka_3]
MTSVPPPPDAPPLSTALFERRYPSSRTYPALPKTTLPPHTLTLTMPHVRLYGQLPPFNFHPLGWVFFGVIAGHPGPGMNYLIKDATGKTIPFKFVDSWMKGHHEPTGKEAEPFKDLKDGTLLCIKCATWSQGMGGRGQMLSVEKVDLQGIKVSHNLTPNLEPLDAGTHFPA